MKGGRASAEPLATVDAGNGSAKVVCWAGERVVSRVRHDYGEGFVERLGDSLRGARAALVSCVASDARRADVHAAARHAGLAVHEPDHGLDLSACRRVHTIGRDRLYAARAAFELTGALCLVVDAGTAVTVDLVAPRAGGGGAFLGGAIAPGPELLRRALAAGAARLFEVDLPTADADGTIVLDGVPALGRESAEALRAGIVHGLRGAVRELAALVEREGGRGAPVRFATGGAAALLLAEPSVLVGARLEPDLVHIGLRAAFAAEGA